MKNWEDRLHLPREVSINKTQSHTWYILYFSIKKGLWSCNTVLGGVHSVALVPPNRAGGLLWKFLALGLVCSSVPPVPAVSSLVGPEGKSRAGMNLVPFFYVGGKERITQYIG